jgi:AcrR family transcriptional regulator
MYYRLMESSLFEPSKRNLPVQKRAKDKYQLILVTACSILEEKGFSGLSTREISRRAECNIATVYRYFDGVNDIIKALGDPFFSGVSRLFDYMSSLLINGDSLDSVIRFFLQELTNEIAENRWILHAEAGIMTDKDLITWDSQLMKAIEIKLSDVLAIALQNKPKDELQVISYRLVRHWKSFMRVLIEYESLDETAWLIIDTTHTSMALIKADV